MNTIVVTRIGKIGDIARVALETEAVIESALEGGGKDAAIDLKKRGLEDLADFPPVRVGRCAGADEIDEKLQKVVRRDAIVRLIDDERDDNNELGTHIQSRTSDLVLETRGIRHLNRRSSGYGHRRAGRASREEAVIGRKAIVGDARGDAHTEGLTFGWGNRVVARAKDTGGLAEAFIASKSVASRITIHSVSIDGIDRTT